MTAQKSTTFYFFRKGLGKHRLSVTIAAVVLAGLIGMAVFAYVCMNGEGNHALTENDAAVKAKEEASEQRDLARKATTRAKEERPSIVAAKRTEQEQRRRAEPEVYCDGISEADRLSRMGMYSEARALLNTLDSGLRGWEYGHLMCRSVRRNFDEPLTLRGHSSRVHSVAFSPDGKRLASGSRDKTIKLWDTVTGNELLTLRGHSDVVTSVAFSPDRKHLASGSLDNTIKLWNAGTGKELHTLKGHSGGVFSIAFSPDSKRLAFGSYERTIKLWDTATGKELLELKGHSRRVYSVAFSPDGKRLASGSVDKTIKLWDTATGKELLSVKGHSEGMYSVAFSPDGKRLASGSLDSTITIRDTATGRGLCTLKGHSDCVWSVAFSPDGKRLASGSRDKTIKLWDTVTGEELITIKGHSGEVLSVIFSPDGKRLASGSEDQTIKLWGTTKELLTLMGHSRSVDSVAFSPDGKRLASGSGDNTVKLWDTVTGKERLAIKGHSSDVSSVAFSPNGNRLASGSRDKTIKLWDTVTGKELLALKGHLRQVYSVIFSPDGKRLASGSRDKTVKVWDTATGKELLTFKGHSGGVLSVIFSPDGKRLASGGEDKIIKLCDTATGRELLSLRGHVSNVLSVAFSPDGKRLASGSLDKTIKLWDTVTGKELLTLKGHSEGVYSVAFSPDGKRMVSGSQDNTIKLWDTATGKELLTLKGHSEGVYSVAFSPDGKRMVSGSQDNTIKLWDTIDWTKSSEQPSQEKPRYYTIEKKDTMWRIATEMLGNGERYKDILKANPGLDPKKLQVGQKIMIPSVHEAGRMRTIMLKGLIDSPKPEKLSDVVKLWASEAVNGPDEQLFRQAVAKLGAGKWEDVLLDSLNAKKFAARGSALTVLAARGEEIGLLKRVKLMTAKTVSVQAMQALGGKFGYIPADGGELLACVILHAGGKGSLDAPARLARQWGEKYKYKFNIRDFHLLSCLAADPSRNKIGRDELVKQIAGRLGCRRHVASGASPFSKQAARMTLPDLWNIVLLDEMLCRPRPVLALRVLADRLRGGLRSPHSGLVFYEGGKAAAKLYPQATDSTRGDRDHIPERGLQRAGFGALCHLHTRFGKVYNGDRAPTSKIELSASKQANFYGLVLTSIDSGTFSAFYYNPDGAVVSLGLFAFGPGPAAAKPAKPPPVDIVKPKSECPWQSEQLGVIGGLEAPECALVDAATGKVYASNMTLDPKAKSDEAKYWGDDGTGSISLLTDSKIEKLHWAKSNKTATMHSPKGLCIVGGQLWIADNHQVVVVDIATGKPVEALEIPGAKFLTDMVSDGKYAYGADTATSRISRVGPGPMKHYKGPASANGLCFRDGKLYCSSWGKHDIYEIDLSGKEEAKPVGLADAFKGLDGIEALPDGSFLVSDQPNNRIVWVSADFKKTETIAKVNKPSDFGIDLKRGRLYVPCFVDNTITVFSLKRK